MKSRSLRAIAAFSALFRFVAAPCGAQVLYIERFEQPQAPDFFYLEIPTGSHSFDNPGWEITNVAPVGVFIDNNYLFTAGQILAFGGSQSPLGNRAETLVHGFTGTLLPQISFDHFTMGTQTQGIRVEVFDPFDNDALLYVASFTSNGQVVDAPFLASPSGDSILLRISQIGNTLNSDSGIDNIVIHAAIPEPAVAWFGLLGVTLLVMRRQSPVR